MAISTTHARIVAACAAGEWADLSGLPDDEREVEASFIRVLMLGLRQNGGPRRAPAGRFPRYRASSAGGEATGPFFVAPPGIRIKGARILGSLDLSDCVGEGGQGLPRLALDNCVFIHDGEAGVIDISGARLNALSLSWSRFARLRADSCRIDGDVWLTGVQPLNDWQAQVFPVDEPGWAQELSASVTDGTATQPVDKVDIKSEAAPRSWTEDQSDLCRLLFNGAVVAGNFNARFVRLRSSKGSYGLYLRGATIDGACHLNDAIVEGGIEASLASIGDVFQLDRARLIAEVDEAFSGQGLTVQQDMTFRGKLRISGRIWLLGAKVGNLFLHDALCDGAGRNVLSADKIRISGSFSVGRGFYASGGLRLVGAHIENNFELDRGVFVHGRDGYALNADNMNIGLDFLVRDDVNIKGGFRINGSQIEKDFDFQGVTVRGGEDGSLFARAVTVLDRFSLLGNVVEGEISVGDMSCGTFLDDPDGYQSVQRLFLDGFHYDRIDVKDGCWEDRARWLARQFASAEQVASAKPIRNLPKPKSLDDYHPQPYLQLARRLSAQGHEADARKILSLRRTVERKVASRRWARPFSWLFWAFFDYGLSATRAMATMIVALVVGAVLVSLANARGALVVDAQIVAVVGQASQSSELPPAPACGDQINAPIYAVDLFIPLIDLRQESKCEVGAAPGARLGPGVDIPAPGLGWTWRSAFAEVELWRWGKAIYGICGWILTSLAILTFSGVLRRQAEQA